MVGTKSPDSSAPSVGGVPVRPAILFPNDVVDAEASQQEGVSDAQVDGDDEVLDEFPARVKPGPPEATEAERDTHGAAGHSTFRSWCADCVQGRGRSNMHCTKGHEGDRVAVLSWDYGFLGTRGSGGGQDHSTATSSDNSESIDDAEAEALGLSPVLCMRDRLSQACFWYLLPKKGREFAT